MDAKSLSPESPNFSAVLIYADPQAAKAATAVAPRKEPRSEPVVNALPVGRIDLKKAEEERKAAEEPVATKKNQGNLGEDFWCFFFLLEGILIVSWMINYLMLERLLLCKIMFEMHWDGQFKKKTQQKSLWQLLWLDSFFFRCFHVFCFLLMPRHHVMSWWFSWNHKLLWFPSPATRQTSQQEAAARAPPVDSKLQLVEKLRKAQSTENGRVLWWSFCNLDLILVGRFCGERQGYSNWKQKPILMFCPDFDTIECMFLK